MPFEYVVVANFSKEEEPFERVHRDKLELTRAGREVLKGHLTASRR